MSLRISKFNNFLRLLSYNHGNFRFYSDRVLPASNYYAWDTSNPVKLRMEDVAPHNYEPLLVQTMMKNTVEKFGKQTAIVSYDGQIKWNYEEYYEISRSVAKGFISLGELLLHSKLQDYSPNSPSNEKYSFDI